MLSDAEVSRRIMKIRTDAGGSEDRCPTCCRPASNPYRRVVDGKIVEGCIDACHTGRLVSSSTSNEWHIRKVAVQMRRDTLNHLKSL